MKLSAIAELNGVVKRYGGLTALDHVSVAIEPGVTGLLGPNGSGKSTLIKAILGLVQTQGGDGRVLGKRWPAGVREIRDLVGYSPEDDCYIAGLTGIESVAVMAELSGLPATEALRRSHEILDFCDVGEERYREVEGYSTGMRQKLKFAQALVHDPPLLILDEPTTGLDPQQRQSMLDRIRTLGTRHGKTILLSTHILPDVKSVCDHVIILVQGQVRVADTLDNLSRPAEPTLHVGLQLKEHDGGSGTPRHPDDASMGSPTETWNDASDARNVGAPLGSFAAFAESISKRGSVAQRDLDGTIRILGIDPTRTQSVWQAAAAAGVAITRMTPARNSLEEMFFEATVGTGTKTASDSQGGRSLGGERIQGREADHGSA
ncbi:MAG: ABC transporter ATP-binding protein [Planctomycetota bacterium]